MGTFHQGKGDLHGITLALIATDGVYVGRCDSMNEEHVVLLDVDHHTEGDGGKTNTEWLERAAKFGVVPKQPRMVLAMSDVREYAPLGDYYRGVGKMTQPAPAPAPTPSPTTETGVVSLTEGACNEVRRILSEDDKNNQGLRLGVAGGGCSGFVYKAELDGRRDGDVVVECDGFSVYLDRKSTIYLRGVVVDYQGGLGGRGFQFQNPNATNTCGCGESFSV